MPADVVSSESLLPGLVPSFAVYSHGGKRAKRTLWDPIYRALIVNTVETQNIIASLYFLLIVLRLPGESFHKN